MLYQILCVRGSAQVIPYIWSVEFPEGNRTKCPESDYSVEAPENSALFALLAAYGLRINVGQCGWGVHVVRTARYIQVHRKGISLEKGADKLCILFLFARIQIEN